VKRLFFSKGKQLLENLIQSDDWLSEEFYKPHPQYYQQYLLYADPLDRFSVVSFVWGPGQKTPLHNYTVWGMIGQLRGQERSADYYRQPDGSYQADKSFICEPGQVATVSPNTHDIHVYGGNIGRIERAVFDPTTGSEKLFILGFANSVTPNLWNAVR
jgi:predicted metal-dependent enzyme (double-stranded beta helix superfamily)